MCEFPLSLYIYITALVICNLKKKIINTSGPMIITCKKKTHIKRKKERKKKKPCLVVAKDITQRFSITIFIQALFFYFQTEY